MKTETAKKVKTVNGKQRSSQKITPCLWFDDQAKEAATFYTSLFKNARIGTTTHYGKEGYEIHGQPEGRVMTVEFEIEGFQFVGLNGGPHFKFTPAISFFVLCESTNQVDSLWNKLAKGGQALMPLDKYDWSEKYGWIQDKFGLSWQLMVAQDKITPKIIPSLMFVGDQAGNAEEAIHFYTHVFKDSSVGQIARYGPGQEPDKEGTIMYADFTLKNQRFAAMDSAQDHQFNFNEAVSLTINCDTQEEVDYYWQKLSAVPEAEQCGWLKDKYGVSWQVSPTVLQKMMSDSDQKKVDRVMKAFLQMKKFDIKKLKKAFEEKN
ncbi:MAG: VOC family protein [Balneolaceae bacterium]|nr:VOC family protein [Balneolaceae bacterium]